MNIIITPPVHLNKLLQFTIIKIVIKRLEFIDLAKGICIFLVVCFHGGAITWPPLLMLRMPLYFILSGLFYKDYGGLINLIIKKTDKLLIPFLFFFLVAIIATNMLKLIFPALNAITFDDISLYKPIPTPVWFLLCLFWDNVIFFFTSVPLRDC